MNQAMRDWIEAKAPTFDFAMSMKNALRRYGTLTVKQAAAVERCMARDAAAQRPAVAVQTDLLLEAFEKAAAAGTKRPVMRFEAFKASLASATGRNPGAVYIKSPEGEYLGKIAGGQFKRVAACDDVTEQAVVATMQDPLAAAVAYGKRTGACSICGRTLSDPVSVSSGIGPICAAKFGLMRAPLDQTQDLFAA